MRIREWGEVHRQLEDIVRELKLDTGAGKEKGAEDVLHRALLTGLLSKVGTWRAEPRVYVGAKQTKFAIHPSSALARKPPAWIMAFELVETTQLFARTAARIEPEWLLEAAPHLLKHSYSEPHWSETSARASIKEHTTLFGLSISRDKSVDYATVSPELARLMFLDHALVRGEYKTRGTFHQKNRELLEKVARLRDKARRSDMLADDDALLAFFDKRVPADVVNGKTFEEWREKAEQADPAVLLLSMDDVLTGDRRIEAADYPDAIRLHGATIPVTYRFDPSAEDDGITLTVPIVLLPQLDPGELDWTIPGWHADKIAALLYELPRPMRRELGDGEIPEIARTLAPQLKPFDGPMIPALARAVTQLTGVSVPDTVFRPDAVAAFLRLTCRLVDESGKVVAQSREIDDLLSQHGARARAAWKSTAPTPAWEKKGLTSWDFGELPPFVVRRVGGTEVRSYPALVDRGTSVDLVLVESSAAAATALRAGVRRLLMLAARASISSVAPRIPAAFARPNGSLLARAESEAFRARVLARIVDAAFGLTVDAPPPRTKAAFDQLVTAGAPRVAVAFKLFTDAMAPAAKELESLLGALRTASKHPSGRAALVDIQAQLEHLFPAELMEWVPLACLEHYPRYLRAAQARLGRAVSDPRKDMDKLAPFATLWSAFLAKRASVRDQAAAAELRWAFEELRVAIFAPELKTPVSVSLPKVAAALAALK
jgi:ATP-dependent helicase HrpA